MRRARARSPVLFRVVILVSLTCLPSSLVACRRPTGPFRDERIPKGSGWQCWTGRCDRVCRGLPGPPDDTGFAPEPACARPRAAFCTTYELHREPHWECFDTQVSCEANQRHYVAEAREGRDYAAVSRCTELP